VKLAGSFQGNHELRKGAMCVEASPEVFVQAIQIINPLYGKRQILAGFEKAEIASHS
jgi:hypothetical protein